MAAKASPSTVEANPRLRPGGAEEEDEEIAEEQQKGWGLKKRKRFLTGFDEAAANWINRFPSNGCSAAAAAAAISPLCLLQSLLQFTHIIINSDFTSRSR